MRRGSWMLLVLGIVGGLGAVSAPDANAEESQGSTPISGAEGRPDGSAAEDGKRSLAFAKTLFDQGLFEPAELEFRRSTEFAATGADRWQAQEGVLACLLARKDFETAVAYGSTIEPDCPDAAARLLLKIRQARACSLLGDPARSVAHLREGLRSAPQDQATSRPELVNVARKELVLSYVELGQPEAAAKEADHLVATGAIDPSVPLRIRSSGETIPHRTPWLMGTTSAVIPGLGQMACQRYTDGVVAFFLVGAFATAATLAFVDDELMIGGVVAFFGVGWYSGNIYGAVNAAHRFNRDAERQYRIDVLQGLRLGPTRNLP